MLSVPGIYKDGNIILLGEIPQIQQARVIITVLEEWPMLPSEKPVEQANHWLGALAHTATIIGDIVQPLDETMNDWEVLQPISAIT